MVGPQPSWPSMTSISISSHSRGRATLIAAAFALVAFGCSTTIIPHGVDDDDKAPPSPLPVESGFLSDYSKLKDSEQFAALKMYRDDSRKGGYHKLLFRPVEVWRGAGGRLED